MELIITVASNQKMNSGETINPQPNSITQLKNSINKVIKMFLVRFSFMKLLCLFPEDTLQISAFK